MNTTDFSVYSSASARAACVVGHGAGTGRNSPFMVRFAEAMTTRGISAMTFDFPYMAAGRSGPDKPPVLEASWRAAADRAKATFGGLPLFIGGKSMGGRIASHIAAQGYEGLAGVFFLGYPLHPPGQPAKRRDAHLPDVKAPMLFVQGTRDEFGTSEEIAALLPALQDATMHVVKDGDHSFKVRVKTAGMPQDAVFEQIFDTVVSWMDRQLAR